MDIDLYRDWVAHLRSELAAFGYDTTQIKSPEEVVHTFLNLTKRLVRPIPRVVLKTKTFSCPNALLPGLAVVEQKIAAGEDISPHLSRSLRSPSVNDYLLNDWGIHHIHLGTTLDPDGFVRRTGPVLFVRFDNVNAYFIDVLPHGSWTLQSLVKDLHDNWEESIKPFRVNGVLGLATSVSDKDVAALRKGNVNTFVDLGDGIVYFPLGGGYSASGLSSEVVIQSDRYAERLQDMQQTIIENIDFIASEAKLRGLIFPDSPSFELQIYDGVLYAVEVNSMVAVPLGEL